MSAAGAALASAEGVDWLSAMTREADHSTAAQAGLRLAAALGASAAPIKTLDALIETAILRTRTMSDAVRVGLARSGYEAVSAGTDEGWAWLERALGVSRPAQIQ